VNVHQILNHDPLARVGSGDLELIELFEEARGLW